MLDHTHHLRQRDRLPPLPTPTSVGTGLPRRSERGGRGRGTHRGRAGRRGGNRGDRGIRRRGVSTLDSLSPEEREKIDRRMKVSI